MYHLFGLNQVSPDFVNFQLVHPQIRSHLHCRTSPASRDGFFFSYHVNFRFKSRFFSNFFTMYTMRIFYYIEQWPYSRQHSFPTLNQHLYPAQTYGTNLMDFDHTILTRPMPSLTQSTSLRLTLLRKKPLWMSCWNLIFQNHINTWLLLSPDALPDPSKLSTTASTPAKRKPNAKATPKAPAKRRRRAEQSRSRSSSPLSTWTFEDKQKLRTLKADEKSRFSWRVISTKMGKSEADVRSMWNKIKDRLG